MFYLFFENFICCILITSSQILPPPYPTNFTFFLTPRSLYFLKSLVHFAFADCWGLWRVIDIPGITPLKKTDLPSPGTNQMPIAPPQWMGLHAHPILHAGMLAGLCLHKSSTYCHSICQLICTHALCVWKTLSLCSYTTSGR